MKRLFVPAMLAATMGLGFGLAGCEKKGPMEQMGEEADEAVDSIREGGESTGDKLDDAVDELRE